MANTDISSEQTELNEPASRGRRWVKVVLVLLLVAGVGSAAAFHFLKDPPNPRRVVEYEEHDVDEAAAKEQAAIETLQKDKKAFEDAQQAFNDLEIQWQKAKEIREQALAALESANANDKPNAQADFDAADKQFADATKKLESARVQLTEARNKLKTADELRAEAEAERKKAEELAAQEKTIREGVLGKWKRSDYYGDLTLELKEDGRGLMVVFFNFGAKLVVGTDRLDVDIKWHVANGDHLIFDSVRGQPEKAFQYVTVQRDKGTHRDEILTNLEENTFTTRDANDKSRIKTWTRIE